MVQPLMYDWDARKARYEAGGQRGGIQGGLSGANPMGNRVDYGSQVGTQGSTYQTGVPAYRQTIQQQRNMNMATGQQPMPPGQTVQPGTMTAQAPQTPPTPQTAMAPGPGQYSQFGQNPLQVAPPTMPPAGANFGNIGNVVAPGAVKPGQFTPWGPNEKNVYGGQQIAGADPSMADYQSVQSYADQAMDAANRWLQPQQAEQNRRMQQELINKGVDPNSAMGNEMQNRLAMQQADATNAAMFGALGFGQGIQQQMAGQEQAKAGLAGQMQQALWQNQLGSSGQGLQWELGKLGSANQAANRAMQAQLANQQARLQAGQLQNQYNLGLGGLGMDRYRADLGQQLGMGQLDLGRSQAEHGQMMDLLGYDMDVRSYNDQQQLIQDALYNQWYGNTPIPGMGPIDVTTPATWRDTTSTNRQKGINIGTN